MRALEIYGDLMKEADTFVRELDETVRLAAFNFLLNEERNSAPIESSVMQASVAAESTRSLSPQELIHVCGAASLMDKAVVLGYWLEEYQGNESFTSADLKNAFLSAREPAPVNPSDVVARLEAARRLMKGPKIGKTQSYRLTRTAMNQVQDWIQSDTVTGLGQ